MTNVVLGLLIGFGFGFLVFWRPWLHAEIDAWKREAREAANELRDLVDCNHELERRLIQRNNDDIHAADWWKVE